MLRLLWFHATLADTIYSFVLQIRNIGNLNFAKMEQAHFGNLFRDLVEKLPQKGT